MAMQSGIGLSKIVILVGAGYTGSIMLRNGRLSDLLAELQSLVKGLETSGDKSSTDSDYSDALAAQVRRLAMEVRQLASSRQITVLNGNSGQIGNMTSLVMPAAALGALGYGYMWWKGLSFSDLMYVTKRNMANAVSSMTKHLEQVSSALAATKRHLTQRIENLDGKLDEQKEISKLIKNEVSDVRADLSQIGYDLDSLQRMVSGLDGKICSLEDKQDFANAGVWYLCNFVGAKDQKMSDFLQSLPKPSNRSRGLISEAPSLKGLKQIADTITSGNIDKTNGTMQNDFGKLENHPKSLTRTASIKC
ncbi:PREDICTED: uncharacterized protein LOC104586743 [Nelumbo nucifera]|uniref:DUF1664 domain-containing protein n=2 Tax=Nelumbo nucifera TaxID=4432 RepID=A0A822YFH5_NELNU|nr:PREDICTED: uncharacterized protein LOC104586743 [Nelumbo nucifera]DAD31172.1 TPA_asm: hypothetical protein HUJ06_010023 [Nelumbo nucifera]